MQRFFVCRAYVKWKGQMYYKGDLLPETFTHHDKARSIYNSRIGVCPEAEIVKEIKEPVATVPAATKPTSVRAGVGLSKPATSGKASVKGISGGNATVTTPTGTHK